MKYILLSILSFSLLISSCLPDRYENPDTEWGRRAFNDSVAEVEKDQTNKKVLTEISTEHLFRYFSSNFHVIGDLPCMYYDPASDEFVISGKKLFTRIKAEDQEDAFKSFHEFLCIRGYSPDGDSALDEYQKVKMNGQDAYIVQMDDLLPELKPDEVALFTPEQITAMNQTSSSYAYKFLANERNCPLMYASSSGITLEGKNLEQEVKMENAKEAFKIYGAYIDSIRAH